MIFGFNTDVKHGDTVYHVQSEAHASTHVFMTTVFVQGRCLGKKSTSYADHISQPDFTEHKMHELLKDQHKGVIEAIKEGRVNSVIAAPASN
ncbi:MAG TPA: hypothetical protein VN577_03495 [Terriglobales bacterium]|nr:hypothetical protein [Terriglobales bacterium]